MNKRSSFATLSDDVASLAISFALFAAIFGTTIWALRVCYPLFQQGGMTFSSSLAPFAMALTAIEIIAWFSDRRVVVAIGALPTLTALMWWSGCVMVEALSY